MEFMKKITLGIQKYRYAILILLIGLAFMLIPIRNKETKDSVSIPETQAQSDICDQLCDILSQIEGAGKVSVMLTVKVGETKVYQSDEDLTSGENGTLRQDTVIVTDENRVQSGLVQHVVSPEYRGAIIVCQGADNAEVRLQIIEAVARVTGLGTDKISVIKMK